MPGSHLVKNFHCFLIFLFFSFSHPTSPRLSRFPLVFEPSFHHYHQQALYRHVSLPAPYRGSPWRKPFNTPRRQHGPVVTSIAEGELSKSKAEQLVQGHRGGKGNQGSNMARLVLLLLLSHQRLKNSPEPCRTVHLTECGGDVDYIFMECLAGCSQLRARLLFLFTPPPLVLPFGNYF